MRAEEDAFATDVARSAQNACKRGMANTIKGMSKEAQRQLKQQADSCHERLEMFRSSAARQLEEVALAERQRAADEAMAQCTKVRWILTTGKDKQGKIDLEPLESSWIRLPCSCRAGNHW